MKHKVSDPELIRVWDPGISTVLVDFLMKLLCWLKVGCNTRCQKKIKQIIWHRSAVTVINVTDFILHVKRTMQSIIPCAEVLRLWSVEPLPVIWGEPAGQRELTLLVSS